MVLQLDRRGAVGGVARCADIDGLAFQRDMVLHQHAVQERGHIGRAGQRSVRGEDRRGPDHVIALPFARRPGRVRKRGGLLVDAARLTVDIGLVAEAIHDLELISGIAVAGRCEEQAAIAARLAFAGDVRRDPPFEVQLIITEFAPRLDVAGALAHGQHAVGHGPLRRRLVLGADPLAEILAVEQHQRVRRRRDHGRRAGRDHRRFGCPDLGVLRAGLRGGLQGRRAERGAQQGHCGGGDDHIAHPLRYSRSRKRLASATLVMRPAAPSYSIG